MAKKRVAKVIKVKAERSGRAVRLDLSEADHVRLEKIARERGLNKAAYARLAVLERMMADEGGGK
jgi:hypothetical protein